MIDVADPAAAPASLAPPEREIAFLARALEAMQRKRSHPVDRAQDRLLAGMRESLAR